MAKILAEEPHLFGWPPEFTDVFFLLLMQENGLVMPKNVEDAEELYVELLQLTSNEL